MRVLYTVIFHASRFIVIGGIPCIMFHKMKGKRLLTYLRTFLTLPDNFELSEVSLTTNNRIDKNIYWAIQAY